MLKRAAAQFQATPASQAALSQAISKEKSVLEAMGKLLDAKKEGRLTNLSRHHASSQIVKKKCFRMAEDMC